MNMHLPHYRLTRADGQVRPQQSSGAPMSSVPAIVVRGKHTWAAPVANLPVHLEGKIFQAFHHRATPVNLCHTHAVQCRSPLPAVSEPRRALRWTNNGPVSIYICSRGCNEYYSSLPHPRIWFREIGTIWYGYSNVSCLVPHVLDRCKLSS